MNYTINLDRPALKQKISQVAATVNELQGYPTVALLELGKLPDALFQSLRNKITREGGKVKVLRKAVLQRVLTKVPALATYAQGVDRPLALILTKSSPYELHKFFASNRKKRAAKPGETAPFEIIVPAGDTDLPPGPALSELKSAGINVQIKAGKIVVAKDSIVAKPGQTLTNLQAKALQKMNILPFEVRARLFIASDEKYAYSAALLNLDETLVADLGVGIRQGMNVALNANYPTPQTAPLLLAQAFRQAIDLSLNASVYNDTTVPTLLSSAVRQGRALEGAVPSASAPAEAPAKEEAKAEEKKEEKKGDAS